jgi:CheY-like chemotaxis protein
LSANAFDSDREAALTAGCNDFLSKPISSKACLEMIAKFLE